MPGISAGFLLQPDAYVSGLVWESVVKLGFRRVKLLKHQLYFVNIFGLRFYFTGVLEL